MSEASLIKERKLEDIKKEAEEKACAFQKVLYFIEEFLAGPMCGKCYPCSLGTAEAGIRLNKIKKYPVNFSGADLQALKRIAVNMIEGSFCKKGRDTGRFVMDVLTNAAQEFEQHVSGVCQAKECISLVDYVIHPDLCVMCGKCSEACKHGAIAGEKSKAYLSGYLPFEIRQTRCVKCGECVAVCPTGAIEAISVVMEEFAH
jgi:NAD-dependent dihydropyrimidine dehydrogenase PreA subunit